MIRNDNKTRLSIAIDVGTHHGAAPRDAVAHDAALEEVQVAPGDMGFASVQQEGQAMTLEQAVADALSDDSAES
jgi:hypothetical protein